VAVLGRIAEGRGAGTRRIGKKPINAKNRTQIARSIIDKALQVKMEFHNSPSFLFGNTDCKAGV
jgi:hypothetical protein